MTPSRPRRWLALLVASAMFAQAPPAHAHAHDLGAIQSTGNRLLAWLISLRAPLDTIVAQEKRDQLRRRLVELNRTLYATEQKIEDLIRALERPGSDSARINARVADLRLRVARFRAALLQIGPLLLQNRQASVERQLLRTSASRAIWVESLEDRAADPAKRAGLAAQGRETLRVLRTANRELATLIARLR